MTFNIFAFEIRGNFKFEDWYKKNSKLATIITLFCSENVELLNLLDSNFANFGIFSAPFSTKALYRIFYDRILNTFIENIPQLIIQVTFERVLYFWFLFWNFLLDFKISFYKYIYRSYMPQKIQPIIIWSLLALWLQVLLYWLQILSVLPMILLQRNIKKQQNEFCNIRLSNRCICFWKIYYWNFT